MELIRIKGKNFCCYDEFDLPLSKQGLVWIGGENKDTKSANNNGSGKSTVFKALTWCLYGQTIDGERGDKVIKLGQPKAQVDAVLSDGTGDWIVRRIRKKGSPVLELIQPDGKTFKADKVVIQDRINDMVGLDYAAFKNTVLYGQNDSARFAHPRTRDSERKEMLHRILGTGILKQCHEKVRERKRELKSEIDALKLEMTTVDVRISEQDVEGLQRDVDEFEENRQETISEHRKQSKLQKKKAASAISLAKTLQQAVEEDTLESIKSLENDIQQWKKQLLEAREAEKKQGDMKQAVDRQKELVDILSNKLMEVGHRLHNVQDELQLLNGDKCPTCSSPLRSGAAADHVAAKRAEAETLSAVQQNLLEQKQADAAALSEITKKRESLQEEAEKAWNLTECIERAQDDISDLKQRESRIESQIKSAKEKAEHHIEMAREQLAQIKSIKLQKNPYEERLERAKQAVKKYTKQLKKLKADSKALSKEQAHIEFWVRGFSNQGLPSYILDAVMPFITNRANHYLETLTDGDIVMNFTTQREMKSSKGDYRDEIDITWQIEGIEDSYPPSGGQLKKMEIATDLALMDLVASREGEHLDLLALDEVLDGLDSEGCQRVLMLLQKLRSQRNSIFVISHEAEVAEMFEKAVMAVKENGSTKLEMVA